MGFFRQELSNLSAPDSNDNIRNESAVQIHTPARDMGPPGQGNWAKVTRIVLPGQDRQVSMGWGPAYSSQELKMTMIFFTEMVLDHHVADMWQKVMRFVIFVYL